MKSKIRSLSAVAVGTSRVAKRMTNEKLLDVIDHDVRLLDRLVMIFPMRLGWT